MKNEEFKEIKDLDILIFPSIDIDIQSEPFLLRPP
jgi:hypothetical protein